MYEILIPKIKTVLDAVKTAGKLAYVYDHPVTKFEGYPVAIFVPAAGDNVYLTNIENAQVFRFKIWIITETKIAGMKKAWTEVLPKAVDAVLQEFNEEWDQGAVDGHRLWWLIERGDWRQSNEQDGTVIYTELDLIINLITNN